MEEIRSMLGVGRSTLYRYLGESGKGGAKESREDGKLRE